MIAACATVPGPGFDIIDVEAPAAPMAAPARARSGGLETLEAAQRKPEMKGGLLHREKGIALSRDPGALVAVVHGYCPSCADLDGSLGRALPSRRVHRQGRNRHCLNSTVPAFGLMGIGPRLCSRHGGRSGGLVVRVPDDGEGVLVILARGTAEIGIETAGSELGCGQAQRHIVLAGHFAAPQPSRPDVGAGGNNPEIRLDLAGLAAVGDDLDIGADREGAKLALEAMAIAGDKSDCGHFQSPWLCVPDHFRATHRPAGRPRPAACTRRAAACAKDRARALFGAKRREEPIKMGGEIRQQGRLQGAGGRTRSLWMAPEGSYRTLFGYWMPASSVRHPFANGEVPRSRPDAPLSSPPCRIPMRSRLAGLDADSADARARARGRDEARAERGGPTHQQLPVILP
ncbi:hypothetical protein LTR94_025097, partial [Friedmanniomyces endolithicus]